MLPAATQPRQRLETQPHHSLARQPPGEARPLLLRLDYNTANTSPQAEWTKRAGPLDLRG